MIEIWEPRYHDMVLLIKPSRLTPGQDADIRITKGSYAGEYLLPGNVIGHCSVEHKDFGDMVIVPFESLINKEKKDEEEHI